MRDAWKIGRGEMDERTRSATGAIIGPVLSLQIANEKALMTRDTETGIDRHTESGVTKPVILKNRHGITAALTRSSIGTTTGPVWTGVAGTEPSVHGPGDRRVGVRKVPNPAPQHDTASCQCPGGWGITWAEVQNP